MISMQSKLKLRYLQEKTFICKRKVSVSNILIAQLIDYLNFYLIEESSIISIIISFFELKEKKETNEVNQRGI